MAEEDKTVHRMMSDYSDDSDEQYSNTGTSALVLKIPIRARAHPALVKS